MGYNRHFWPRFPALSSILGYIMVKIRPRPDLNSFLSRIVAKSWARRYLPAFLKRFFSKPFSFTVRMQVFVLR